MNTRTTLVLALVALGVAGFLFISKPWEQPAADKPAESVAKVLYDPKPKDIDRIEFVSRGGRDKFVFRKQDNAWQMVEPIEAPASEFEVNGLVDRIGEIKYVKTYAAGDENRPSDQVSGLAKPETLVKLYTGDKLQADVMIGKQPPTGSGTYVKIGGSDVIYEANTDLQSTFNKKLENFRDRRVVKFELKDVTRVKVEGLQNYELSQSNGTWVVESPTRSRGDKEQIEKLVRPISNLYIQDWKDDEPVALRPYQLDKPRLRLTIDTTREIPPRNKPGDPNTQPADTQPSTETKTFAVLIGGATDPSATSYFAKLEKAPWVFSLGESTIKELSTAIGDLRDKKLFADTSGEIIQIEATTPEGPMSLAKQGAEWKFADGGSADAAAVDELVKTLQNLKGEYADPSLIGSDWSRPRAELSVTRRGAASPTTLLVGQPSPSGQMVYVKNKAEEPVRAVSRAEADQLLAGATAYQDRTVLRFPHDQATRVEITTVDQPKIVLTEQADKWSMAEPVSADADPDAARNLVADLASLRAKRVVGKGDQIKADKGLNQPQVKLAVYTEVPAPRPATTAPAVTPQPPATAPAPGISVTPPLTSPAVTAVASTRPAAAQKKSPAERVQQLEELLQYQTTTLRAEGKENPKATEMLQAELERARREAGISTQPAIQGAPQGAQEAPATQPASAATQPAPKPEIRVYHLSLTQKDGTIYAALDDQPLVYELDRKIFDDATAEMHDRQLLKFEVNNVTELGFDHGGMQVVVRKSGDDWKYVVDPLVAIDTQKVTEVLNVFRDLKTHDYVQYKDADLSKYGLDKDVERMWVVLNDGKRIEVVLSKTGPVNDKDKSRYATLAGETRQVFLLKGDQAAKFQQKLEDFQKSASPAPAAGTAAPPSGLVD